MYERREIYPEFDMRTRYHSVPHWMLGILGYRYTWDTIPLLRCEVFQIYFHITFINFNLVIYRQFRVHLILSVFGFISFFIFIFHCAESWCWVCMMACVCRQLNIKCKIKKNDAEWYESRHSVHLFSYF